MSTQPKIIARGYDDKPAVLFVLELQPGSRHVNVSGSLPPSSYIGWPINDAFDYDEDDWKVVSEAYDSDDRAVLTARYHEMEQRPKRFVDALSTPSGGK